MNSSQLETLHHEEISEIREGKNLSKETDFFLRRLHSLLGVIPVGLFVAQHLVINHFATRGEEAFNNASNFMGNLPFVFFLEWFIIYIPLMFHAFYGVYIAFSAKYNIGHYGTFRNWMFTLQRFTGVFLVIFIAWHVYETRIQKALGVEVDFNMMADILSNPLMLAFYIVGILSATFHLANGLWSFSVTWGIAQSPNAQKIVSYITIVVFLVLSVIGVQALLAFV